MSYDSDTHDPAVQACAVRLISELRKKFPDVAKLYNNQAIQQCGTDEEPLTDKEGSSNGMSQGFFQQGESGSKSKTKTSSGAEAQDSLLKYLDAKINQKPLSELDLEATYQNPSISGTMQLIDVVLALPREKASEKEKKLILEQIQNIAAIYPGGSWDADKKHWSINSYYDRESGEKKQLVTPPAEALNLTCRAIFDSLWVYSEPGKEEEYLQARIETAYTYLLDLGKQHFEQNLQTCSGGLQHGVLYWLNGVMLDEHHQPIILLNNIESFLKDSLLHFVADELEKYEFQDIEFMLENWLQWLTSNDFEQESPLIIWLREQYGEDEAWQAVCISFIEQRCLEFSIDPMDCKLSDWPKFGMSHVPIPGTVLLPFVTNIMLMTEVRLSRLALDARGESSQVSMSRLIEVRNHALQQFQASITVRFCQTNRKSVNHLFKALNAFDRLNCYQDMRIFIEEEDVAFQNARNELKSVLYEFFCHYSLEKLLPLEYGNIWHTYKIREASFKEQVQFDESLINNIFVFARQDDIGLWLGCWGRLNIQQNGRERLYLTDAKLEELRISSQQILEDGTEVLDLTPYTINRILIHGLVQPFVQWTPTYKQYVCRLTQWLLMPAESGDKHSIIAFKKSLPKQLLVNLWRIAHLLSSEELSQALRKKIADCAQRHANIQPQTFVLDSVLRCFFTVPIVAENVLDEENFSQEERAQIWAAMNYDSAFSELLIQTDIDNFYFFFEKPLDIFSKDMRDMLWRVAKTQLGRAVGSGGTLALLLSLSTEQLSAEQRFEIIDYCKNNPQNLVVWSGDLDLLALPLDVLDETFRLEFWGANKSKLKDLGFSCNQIVNLFNLSLDQFCQQHRDELWVAILDNFDDIFHVRWIDTDTDHYKKLFQLPTEKFTLNQRSDFLTISQNHTADMIFGTNEEEDKDLLLFWLNLPNEKFDHRLRTQLFAAIQHKLHEIILNGDYFDALFSLSMNQLDTEQRTLIIKSIKHHLQDIFQDGKQFLMLMSLPMEKLNEEQRIELWEAMMEGGQFLLSLEGCGVYVLQRFWFCTQDQLPHDKRDLLLHTMIDTGIEKSLIFDGQSSWRKHHQKVLSALKNCLNFKAMTHEQAEQLLEAIKMTGQKKKHGANYNEIKAVCDVMSSMLEGLIYDEQESLRP